MAETTVGDRVAELASKGYTASQISERFKSHYGIELKSVPKDMWLSSLDKAVSLVPKFDSARPSPPAKPQPSTSERILNWAGGVVTGLPAAAYGALGEIGKTAPAQALGKVYDFVNDPFGIGEGMTKAMLPPKPKQAKPEPDRIAEAQAASKALRQGRAETPTASTFLQDVGDVAAGVGRLGAQALNLEGPVNESPIETAKRRFGQGQELTAGVIGGTADLAKGLVTDDWSTNPLRTQPVTTALTFFPMAKGANLGVRAAGEAAARRGGTVGRVGATVAEATRAADIAGERLHGAGDWIKEKLTEFPGSKGLFDQLQQDVANGVKTAAEAAKEMDAATPWQSRFVQTALSDQVRPGLQRAGRIAKGAAYGALIGDAIGGPIGGALAGAGVAGAVELARAFSPVKYARARAAYRRNVVDPSAQETPAQTELMRTISEEPVRRAAEVQTLSNEAAARIGQGQVDFDISSKPQATAAPMYERLTFEDLDRGLVPLEQESLGRELLGEETVGKGRYLDLLEKRGDTAGAEALRKDLERQQQGVSWPLALDIEAQLKEPGKQGAIASRTTSHAFNEIVNQVRKAMTAADQEVSPQWFQRALTAALDDTSTAMNYSPRFRKIVIDEAAHFMGIPRTHVKTYKAFALALDNKLVELSRESLGPEPKSIKLTNVKGQEIALDQLQKDAVNAIIRSSSQPAPSWYKADRRLPPLSELQKDITERIGQTLRMQTEDTHLANAIDRERKRFLAPAAPYSKTNVINPSGIKDPATYAVNIADRVASGDPMPLLTVFDPKKMAAHLRQIANTGLVPVGRTVAEIKKLADYFETMRPVSAEVAQYMSDQKQLAMVGDTPGTGMWAAPGADAALTARVKLLQVGKNAGFLDKMLQQFKLANTAFRLKTWTNNIGSNIVFQSVRSGKLPTEVLADVTRAAQGMRQYLKDPKSLPHEDVQMYRSLAHGGLGSLAQLEGDFNALTAMSSTQGKIGAAIHHTSELAKKGYGWGDMPFKISESVDRYRQTMNDLSKLGDNEFAKLRLSYDSAIEVKKVGNHWYSNGKYVTPEQLSDLVGRAAVTFAQDSFINTAHAPVWLQTLHSGRWTNLASPFLAWAWGAMEAPGKQGLLRRAAFFDGNSLVDTNNPALLARNAARSFVLGARRDMLNKMVLSQLHPNRDEIRQIFPFAFGNEGAVDIQANVQNPFAVDAHDFGPMNPFSRAALMWRLGEAGVGMLYGAAQGPGSKPWEVNYEKLTPDEKRRYNFFTNLRSKQVATVKDAFDAASLAGNMFIDLARDLEATSRPDAKVDASAVLSKFVISLMGGTATDAAKIAYGTMVDPYEKLTGRPYMWTGPNAGPDDAGRWAIQSLFGLGYQSKELYGKHGKLRAYLSKMSEALNNAVDKDYEDRINKIASNSSLSDDEKTKQIEELSKARAKAQQWVSQEVARQKVQKYKSAMKFSGMTKEESDTVVENEEKAIQEKKQLEQNNGNP